MGVKTDPIKYRKFVMLSMGHIIAATVPKAATTIATTLTLTFSVMDLKDIPAEKASRKVVVTVEKITISIPAIPNPAAIMISARSILFKQSTAPIPIIYMNIDTRL